MAEASESGGALPTARPRWRMPLRSSPAARPPLLDAALASARGAPASRAVGPLGGLPPDGGRPDALAAGAALIRPTLGASRLVPSPSVLALGAELVGVEELRRRPHAPALQPRARRDYLCAAPARLPARARRAQAAVPRVRRVRGGPRLPLGMAPTLWRRPRDGGECAWVPIALLLALHPPGDARAVEAGHQSALLLA